MNIVREDCLQDPAVTFTYILTRYIYVTFPGSGFLVLLCFMYLLVIKHILSVQHPFPSCGDISMGT